MKPEKGANLRRTEIREILRRHRGAINRIAAELGVSHVSVSRWLSGKATSARIATAAERLALDLRAKEAA